MNAKKLNIEIDEYLDKNWNNIVDDIASLIEIPSSTNDGKFNKEFPTGTGACKAMNQALKIAKKLGFKTKNHKNMIGIADYKGESDTQIGFIGHCDVVVPGTGWHFDPYKLNIVNGYMIGRGVLDDKGPSIILLHAINYWIKRNKKVPYSIRFLFGTDEETFSTDIKQFKKDFDEPKIIITPDADFPVQYGEKGLMRFIVSQKFNNGEIQSIVSGESTNAVSGKAVAICKCKDSWIDVSTSRLAHAVKVVSKDEEAFEITAKGRAAHAATPYYGIDSVAILSHFFMEKNIGTKEEQEFFKFLLKIAGRPKGEGVGLNVGDKHFKDLTIVPTKMCLEKGTISQIFDVRFPTCTSPEKIEKQIRKHMPKGAKYECIKAYPPFIVNPDSKLVDALSDAYESATGEETKKFTMGGATYARNFHCGTSFGPLRDWVPKPAWVGTLHGPDEGVSEDEMKLSFKIYVHMMDNLMNQNINDDFVKDALSLR